MLGTERDASLSAFPNFSRKKKSDGLQGGKVDRYEHMKPVPFTKMTSRGLTESDKHESDVIAANVFIRGKPLWHPHLDEKRFENIDKDPEILTRTKIINQPKWKL